MVERCTGIAEVKGLNPVQAWIFFRLCLCNCISCVYNCNDLLSSKIIYGDICLSFSGSLKYPKFSFSLFLSLFLHHRYMSLLNEFQYSETLPYGHLGNTVTSLLWPLYFDHLAKRPYIFLLKKPLLIRSNLYGPLVIVLTATVVHCFCYECRKNPRTVCNNYDVVYHNQASHLTP